MHYTHVHTHTLTTHLHAHTHMCTHTHTHALHTHTLTTHLHAHTHTQHNLVSLLVSSINYLEHAERYEMMAEVFKLLQPFYEKQRDFKVGGIPFLPGGGIPFTFLYSDTLYVMVLIKVLYSGLPFLPSSPFPSLSFSPFPQHMTEMYGKLHSAFRKVVDIMATGKRYLGTYFRVAFFGKVGRATS